MDEIFRRPQLSKGLSRTDERQEVQADLERADNGYARSFEGALGNRLPTLQNAQAPAEAFLSRTSGHDPRRGFGEVRTSVPATATGNAGNQS